MFYLTKSETVMPHFNLEVVGNIAYKIKKRQSVSNYWFSRNEPSTLPRKASYLSETVLGIDRYIM